MTSIKAKTPPLPLPPVAADRGRYLLLKRAFDVALCLCALPFLLILMFLIAFLVVLDTPGWPLFVQERVGKDAQRFRLYKFRTMRADYDNSRDQAYMRLFVTGESFGQAIGQDAINKPIRTQDITRVGRVVRRLSRDELPQVVNVLKGDMSLIGPRPNVPWEVECYKEWHLERLAVRPGITGLAQVHGRSTLSFDEIAAYDIEYVRSLSLALDLSVMMATFRVVVTRKGAL